MTGRFAVLLLAGMLACGSAAAQRMSKVDGNRLMGMCSAPASKIECESYLSGVADAIAAGGKANAEACIPPPVTITQLHDVVMKYLKDHPGERELKAGLLTLRAYAGAFACRK
jgi:hypothetical protein